MTSKRLVVSALLFTAIVVSHENSYCSQAKADSVHADAGPPEWPLFDPSAKIIDANAGVLSARDREMWRKMGMNPALWQEVGTRNGVPFRLGFRGVKTNGVVAGEPDLLLGEISMRNSWAVQCSVDPMTDKLGCIADRAVKFDPKLSPVVRLFHIS